MTLRNGFGWWWRGTGFQPVSEANDPKTIFQSATALPLWEKWW